jgi:hypothetical protein
MTVASGAYGELDWILEDDVRAALAQALEQEGWFNQYFITRVLARLDGAGYRLVKVAASEVNERG